MLYKFMLQTEVFGSRSGITAWHVLPQCRTERQRFLSEIILQPDIKIKIPDEFAKVTCIKKNTHRSMVQISPDARNRFFIIISEIVDEQDFIDEKLCPAMVITEEKLFQLQQLTIIFGTRWRKMQEKLVLKVRKNGLLHRELPCNAAEPLFLETEFYSLMKPGDLIEVILEHRLGIVERIAVNLGLKQSA